MGAYEVHGAELPDVGPSTAPERPEVFSVRTPSPPILRFDPGDPAGRRARGAPDDPLADLPTPWIR
jgi:hypothetical protein